MTVCVGAICDDGKTVVVAADKMMTYGSPMNLQIEMPVQKVVSVSDTVALLFAGSVPDGELVISLAKARTFSKRLVQEIADATAEAYREVKTRRVEETILRPFLGIDFGQFNQLLSQSASSQILGQIVGMITQHNLGLDLLVAGMDDTGAHLYGVTHPGITVPLDTVSFGAIGSGGLHASVRLSLGQQYRTLSLAETVYSVFEAKRAAEVSPGVGRMTDLAIVRETGVTFLKEKDTQTLASMVRERPTLSKDELKTVEEICKGTA